MVVTVRGCDNTIATAVDAYFLGADQHSGPKSIFVEIFSYFLEDMLGWIASGAQDNKG